MAPKQPAMESPTEEIKPIYRPEDLEDSYFGGRLKFKTKIVWPNLTFFLLIHLFGLYGLSISIGQMMRLQFISFCYSYFLGFLGGEGVTLGAHRLWCHRSYKARRPLRIVLILMQTLAGENCCHTWVKEHRQHHKYSDTDGDPHNASRGFFFCHMGWLMMKKHPEAKAKAKTIYMEDIEQDPVVMFQKRHFKVLYLVINAISLMVPCLLWGETVWNTIFICYFWRYIWLLNITWTVNSLAHFYGNKPFDKNIIPTENKIVSFLAYGEGWHNYHHAFPWDYKASEYGRVMNFTRDFIEFCARRGWAYDLKEASQDLINSKILNRGDGTHRFCRKQQNGKTINKDVTVEEETRGW